MKKVLIILLGILMTSSCVERKAGEQKPSLLSNFLTITDNEDKGIKEILEYYGGQCKYSIGYTASTEKRNGKYFELELSKSEGVLKLLTDPEFPASNMAYLFYRNLVEEKDNYQEIHSKIILNSGEEYFYEFPVADIQRYQKRIRLADKVVQLLKEKEFESLRPILSTELYSFDKNEIIQILGKIESQFGNVIEFRPLGFKAMEVINSKSLIQISGIVMRDVQNHGFSIEVDLNSEKDEIFKLELNM